MTTKESSIQDHRLYGSMGDYVSELLNEAEDGAVELNKMSGQLSRKYGKKVMREIKQLSGNFIKLMKSYPTRFHVGRLGKFNVVARLSVEVEKKLKESKSKKKDERSASQQALFDLQKCVRKSDFEGAMKAYKTCYESKDRQCLKQIFGPLLHICVAQEKREVALKLYEDMKAMEVKRKESVFYSLIQLQKNDLKALRTLLQEMRDLKVVPHLRDWRIIIVKACAEGHKSEAFRMFLEMRSVLPTDVDPSEDIFRSLLDVCSRTKDLQSFYFVLEEMLEVVTSIEDETRIVLERFFQNDESKWTLLRSCVKKETGCVPELDDVKVKLVHMSKLECKELLSQVTKITCKSKVKTKQFKQFMSWLKRNGPFDVFIDTANVGIFSSERPSSGHGIKFCASQVEAMRKHFVEAGRKPLLVMHSKWMKSTPSIISKEWKDCSFVLQKGNNDDLYWLAAAVRVDRV